MKKCPKCDRYFPNHLINLLVSSAGNTLSCPICALEHGNKMHDINRTDFDGVKAKQLLAEAKEFLNRG